MNGYDDALTQVELPGPVEWLMTSSWGTLEGSEEPWYAFNATYVCACIVLPVWLYDTCKYPKKHTCSLCRVWST